MGKERRRGRKRRAWVMEEEKKESRRNIATVGDQSNTSCPARVGVCFAFLRLNSARFPITLEPKNENRSSLSGDLRAWRARVYVCVFVRLCVTKRACAVVFAMQPLHACLLSGACCSARLKSTVGLAQKSEGGMRARLGQPAWPDTH